MRSFKLINRFLGSPCKSSPLSGSPWSLGLLALWVVIASAPASAQRKDEKTYQDVTLETKDGVLLRCTYYPGQDSKTTVPMILLHGWGGQRGELHNLALYLQQQKHAVLLPDLRGHGRSTKARTVRGEVDIDYKDFNRNQIAAATLDLEACKQFMMARNNEGKVNIEQLCILGADATCILALNWSAVDWNAPRLPTLKQGQDVKALILLSPSQSYKGVTTKGAMAHPIIRSKLSILMVAGQRGSDEMADAKRLHKSFERGRVEGEGDLRFYTPDTSLQGTRLFSANLNVHLMIRDFVRDRLVNKAQVFKWTDRKSPLSDN